MSSKGLFIISLDFELHWGSIDRHKLNSQRKKYYNNARKAILEILKLFSENDIHATWATVGFLINSTKDELVSNVPNKRPDYHDKTISPYIYLDQNQVGENENEDPFHLAGSLIGKIKSTPYQEIGTHTFSHYYCNEAGQTIEDFRADLEAAKNVSIQNGINISSLVFPRNQFNPEYLNVCAELGITTVRTNPNVWWWKIDTKREPYLKRLFRGMDSYLKLSKRTSFPLAVIKQQNQVWLIPASRLLKPYISNSFLNNARLKRITEEMTRAAINNEVYHLWWHPHNFGVNTDENLKDLEKILHHYKYLRDKFGFESLSMGEVVTTVLNASKEEKTSPY